MLVSAAITHIRNRTGHDVDGQVNDTTMLLPWIEQEARRLRRRLSQAVPEPFITVSGIITVALGEVIELAADVNPEFERLWSVEKRVSGSNASSTSGENAWSELPVYVEGSPFLGYREEGAYMRFYPESLAAGDYRVKYIGGLQPAALTTGSNLNGTPSGTVVGLPLGLEDVVIERVCALVSTRVPGDDPAPHYAEADRIWKEQLPSLKKRYGRSVKQGFRSVKEWGW